MARRRTIVVVGASLAGATAVATLRDEGFDGRLVLIGDEPYAPYERPPLSKDYLRGERSVGELFVRPDDFWASAAIETRFGERATELDPVERVVTLEGGEAVAFDRALVATGVRNRRLDVPGQDLEGVFALRTLSHCDAIRDAARSAGRAVVVGFGFIGAEVAASLRALGLEVEVVERLHTAMPRVLGDRIGRIVEAIHRDQGVRIRFEDAVARFEGTGRLERVVTQRGAVIDCDMAVIGVGTEPNVEVMRGRGLSPDGGVEAGPTLETAFDGVFTAGDVATHEHPLFGPLRVEHYDNALRSGEAAARNLLGAGGVFADPHWFWSDQFDHELQVAGVLPPTDDATLVVRGSFDERRFCAFVLDDGGVIRASVSLDWPRDCRRSLALIAAEATPGAEALSDPGVDLRHLVPGTA